MTQNQIRYLQAMEEQRANRAREDENYRSNLAREQETNRSNLENERMAREKWDYEKYGKGGSSAGGVVRTIKAGINDISKLIDATGSAIKEATSTKTPNEMLGTKQPNFDVGGIDVHKVASSARSTMNPYVGKSKSTLEQELKSKQAAMLNPSTAPRSVDAVNSAKKDIAQVEAAIKQIDQKKEQTNKKGRMKQGKLLGIDDE